MNGLLPSAVEDWPVEDLPQLPASVDVDGLYRQVQDVLRDPELLALEANFEPISRKLHTEALRGCDGTAVTESHKLSFSSDQYDVFQQVCSGGNVDIAVLRHGRPLFVSELKTPGVLCDGNLFAASGWESKKFQLYVQMEPVRVLGRSRRAFGVLQDVKSWFFVYFLLNESGDKYEHVYLRTVQLATSDDLETILCMLRYIHNEAVQDIVDGRYLLGNIESGTDGDGIAEEDVDDDDDEEEHEADDEDEDQQEEKEEKDYGGQPDGDRNLKQIADNFKDMFNNNKRPRRVYHLKDRGPAHFFITMLLPMMAHQRNLLLFH
mmetsp:Transcript_5453/g.8197  ORF Transcript_5453/g.8197 Transcript_5453/m.8197 type:complete len:320 (+) Transcript_5453:58-1017(+)